MRKEGQSQRIKCEEIMKKGEEDGISVLPDCLLLEILSRLSSTKDSIRTGKLSKRWQYLWTCVPTLIFGPPLQLYQNHKSMSDFALTVDKTLAQCRQLKLKKFQVQTFYDITFESQLRNWIRFAVRYKVEELKLEFRWSGAEFVLDEYIFINSCFTDLRPKECKLNPSGAISWENLRSLRVSWVNINQDLILNIVSGSPLLETLVLEYCWWANINRINAPPTSLSLTQCRQLKQLKIYKLYTSSGIQFQSQINIWIWYAIRCNIQKLNLAFWKTEYSLDFILDQIFFTSSCVTELTLHGCMLNPVGEISWKNLRSLCISGYKSLDEDLIENILSGSPVLETLALNYCYGYRRLHITSKSVKHLLYGIKGPYCESNADIIEINAPNIISLKIQGHLVLRRLLLLDVSSLVKANLSYYCAEEVEQEMLKGYIMNLCHVKELEIGNSCSKVLSRLQAKGFVFPSNVKLTLVKDN